MTSSAIASLLLSLASLLSGLSAQIGQLNFFPGSQVAQVASSQNLPLLQQGDLSRIGSFRLQSGQNYFSYGLFNLSFYRDPTNGKKTLFAGGHDWYQTVGQVDVSGTPGAGTSYSNWPIAPTLQAPADVTEGHLNDTEVGYGPKVYGTLAHNGRLIIGASSFYDGSCRQNVTHGVSTTLNLNASGDFQGFFAMSGSANPRSKGGFMATIPSEWQNAFGGKALTGNGGLSIISCSSSGPSATVFDPDDVGNQSPIPGATLVFYPLSNPIAGGGCNVQSDIFNCATKISGMAFPGGTNTVLFFGRHGTGPICYKCNGAGGYDSPPYRAQIWAYDASELLKVKNGQLQAHQVQPYGVWDVTNLLGTNNVWAVAYDGIENRIYVGIRPQGGDSPSVVVLQVNSSGSPNPTPTTDTTKPTVSITSPSNGGTVSGIATVSATASDNVGVVGVQFVVNGSNISAEDTLPPYSVSWNTSQLTNGVHTLTATARDSAGNTSVATITVNVNNQTTTPPPSPTNPALVGHWTFDEGTGSIAYDYSSNGSDGTISGAVWTTGKKGNALSFDGVDDYVNIPNSSSLDGFSQFTLSAWVMPNNFSSARTILAKNNGSGYLMRFQNSSTFRFYTTTSSGFINSQTSFNFSPNTWYHVVGVYDGSQMKTYINGNLVGSSSQSGSITSSSAPFYIGRYENGSLPFSGAVDDVRVYNYSMSPSEVLNLYNNVDPTPTPTPTPVDATVSAWSSWTATTNWSTCVNGTQTRTEERTRTIISPALNGGTTPHLSETRTVSQSCSSEEPSVSTKFFIGEAVETTVAINIRSTPNGTVLGTQAGGSIGTVVGGPTKTGGYDWWQVNYLGGPDGWSAEDFLTKYTERETLPPVPEPVPEPNPEPAPTPEPTPEPSPAPTNKFSLNESIITSVNVSVRDNPDGKRIDVQRSGSTGTVLSGPVVAGEYKWWMINYTNGADGWSAEDYLNSYSRPTPTTGGSSENGKFSSGQSVRTTANLSVRSTPNGTRVGLQKSGSTGKIINGPITTGSYSWWQIDYSDGADGWSAEDYLQ